MHVILATQLVFVLLAAFSSIFGSYYLQSLAFSIILSGIVGLIIVRTPYLKKKFEDEPAILLHLYTAAEAMLWLSVVFIPLSLLTCLNLYGVDFIVFFDEHLLRIQQYSSALGYLISTFALMSVIASDEELGAVVFKAVVVMPINTITIFAMYSYIFSPIIVTYF